MARLGRFLLIGVVVLLSLGLPAPVATGAATSAAAPVTLTLTAGPGGSVAADPPGPTHEAGAIVTLTATPAAGNLFVGWTIDGVDAGWANPRKLVMDADHAVVAAFAPSVPFTDLPADPAEAEAIRQISARGIIKGYTPAGCASAGLAVPCFGGGDTVLRGEVAVMIVRAMGWDDETPAETAPFVDIADMDPEIQRAIAILAERGVMLGYGDGRAGPTDPVLQIQVVSFIARSMVEAGLWTAATTNDPTLYPNIPASSAHRLDLVTFVHNAGPIPGQPQNQPWADYLAPAPRAWTALLLWQALDATFTGGPYNPGGPSSPSPSPSPPASPTNRPPVAVADSYAAAANAPLTVAAPGVLGNDSDPDGDALTAVLGTGPTNGTLTLNPDGGFTYTPAAGFTGADNFTYQARDPSGATSAVTTVTLTVTAGDPAPTVTGTTPASGATGVAGGAAITVTFSEAVNATAASFQLACPTGTPQTFALSAAPATSYTLTPAAPLPAGVTCTVTVLASAVTDTDTDDPPDAMAANHVFAFTIDEAPEVVSTTPANGASNVAADTNITVTFSEAVTVTGDWFTILCEPSGAHTAAVSGGPTTYTLNPDTDFAPLDGCTVTIVAALVADVDAADPPDTMAANYVFSFGADVPPSVASTTPANNATGVANNTNLTVTFNEPVTVTGAWFAIACPTSGPRAVGDTAVTSADQTTFTIDPNADFAATGETCTMTIESTLVVDQDTDDPPDQMAADFAFDYTTDAAPSVTSTSPTNNGAAAPTTTITVNFSEDVTATVASFAIECPTGTAALPFALSASPATSFTLTPNAPLPAGSVCTVTVVAAQVTDTDTGDPPDNLTADYVFSFTADAIPTVTTTTPADGATGVAVNTTIVVSFSEPVNATTSSFQVECPDGTAALPFALSASPAASYTLTPNAPLPAGVVCTVTVVAAQVTDTDGAPDNLAADYVFSFTTDAAPAVTTTTPANGATGVATDTAIAVNFSEPVNATTASFTLACPVGTAVAFAVAGSGTATVTLTPTASLPEGIVCTVTVVAAQVTDVDTGDPPDTLAADVVFTFTTDTAPTVTATTPANGASAALNTDITVTFSEPVTVTGSWFTISCTISGAHTAVVSGGPTTYTLNPDTDLTAGDSCTVTIVATQVTDQDPGDPPDTLAADYVFSFTGDAPPTVQSTTPTNGATGVPSNGDITVTFSEPVNVTGGWLTIVCTVSGPHSAATSGGMTTFILNPDVDFATTGESCTVTIVAAQVTDQDGTPDNLAADYVFSFTTDAAPAVTTTLPANGATGVAANSDIAITFSEAVTAPGAAFTLVCGTPVAFVATGSGTSVVTLNPAADLPTGATCTVTVLAAQVIDADANDPPDNLAADYVFSFTTDAAPTVTATTPLNNATNVATNTNLTITFSEPVVVTGNWFQIICPTSGTRNVVDTGVTGGPTTFTINPNADFAANEACVVNVNGTLVADQDAADPPDTMATDYAFGFLTDAAPSVTTTVPANGATGVATNATITVNFSEPVTATTSSFTVACPVGTPRTFALSASPAASYTLTPSAPLPGGTVCTVTVLATGISDVDTGDPPDNLAANYVFTFTLPPVATNDTYTATIIGNVGVNTANNSGFSILTNDVGAAPLTVTTSGTTANGGTVVVAPSGTFTYTPAPGFEGDDSFTYTVTNTAGTSAPATVTLQTVSGVIWFVNANAATNGNGRIGTPFNCLTGTGCFSAVAADDPGDRIFLYESATAYAGPLTLLANQRLIGQDATGTLAALAGVTPPPDTIPLPTTNSGNGTVARVVNTATTGGTDTGVILATSAASTNHLYGLTLGNAELALSGNNFGALTVADVIINTTGQALSLTTGALAGSFLGITSTGGTNNILLSAVTSSANIALGGGALSGSAAGGAAVSVVGGTIGFTYTGSVTKANNNALLSVTGGHATGTLTFQTGTLNATSGTGLQFDNADGTYAFNGTTTLAGGAGINIQNGSGGTFTFGTSVAITSPTGSPAGAAFRVNGSTPGVTYSGNITKGNSGRLVDITDQTSGTITFQTGTLTATDGTGILLNNTDGTVTFSGTTTLNGGDAGIDIITGAGGTIAFAATTSIGASTSPSGIAFHINGATTAVTANVTYNGTIRQTNAFGAVVVATKTGGTTSFAGAITANTTTASAINLTDNAGATISFSGGLAITTSTGVGFNATGPGPAATSGGTVTVTGTNTIASTSATALNVANTTIGAGGLNFQSISAGNTTPSTADNPANGIVLNNTGATAGLTVTGSGTTDASGGTIQNITTRGAQVSGVRSLSLSNMAFVNANNSVDAGMVGVCEDLIITGCNAALYLRDVTNGVALTNVDLSGTMVENGMTVINVTGFMLTNSTLTNCGNGAQESCIEASNLGGTVSVTGSNVSFCATNCFDIVNTDTALTMTIDNSIFRDTQTLSAGGTNGNGEGGFQFRSFSTAAGPPTSTIIIKNSQFLRLRTQGIQAIGEDDSTLNIAITNNTIDSGADIGTGIDLNGNDTATVNFNILNNPTIRSNGGAAVNITSFLSSTVKGRVNNNPGIVVANIGAGIRLLAQENSNLIAEAVQNTITLTPAGNTTTAAIDVQARVQTARLDVTLNDNTTAVNTGNVADINITAGSSAAGETNVVCANLVSNNASGTGSARALRVRVSSDVANGVRAYLEGFTTDTATTWINKGNTPANAAEVTVSLTGTAVAPSAPPASGTCRVPDNPILSTAPNPLVARSVMPLSQPGLDDLTWQRDEVDYLA